MSGKFRVLAGDIRNAALDQSERQAIEHGLSAAILFDSSGSMYDFMDAVADTCNDIVEGYRSGNDRAPYLTLASFADVIKYLHVNVPATIIKKVAKVRGGGGTALYDSIGDLIVKLEETSGLRRRVCVCIVTDMRDTCSEEHTRQSITAEIKRKQADGWLFKLFIIEGTEHTYDKKGHITGTVGTDIGSGYEIGRSLGLDDHDVIRTRRSKRAVGIALKSINKNLKAIQAAPPQLALPSVPMDWSDIVEPD